MLLTKLYKHIDAAHLPLVFAPESGNMLGGTVVNITGPCFNPNERVLCKFDTESVIGHVIDRNRAICVQPFLFAQGYIRFEISIGTENFKWRGRYFVGEWSAIFFFSGGRRNMNKNKLFISLNRNTSHSYW